MPLQQKITNYKTASLKHFMETEAEVVNSKFFINVLQTLYMCFATLTLRIIIR